MAILAALVLGVVGFLSFGIGAAIWMGYIYGSNSGGTEMSSIFTFGPVGALAGILLGVGLVLRFTGGSAGWAKGLTIGAGSLSGLAVIVLSGLALAHPRKEPAKPVSFIVFQVEFPLAALVEEPSWGSNPANMSFSSIEKSCSGDTCTFTLLSPVEDTFSGGAVTLAIGVNKYIFPVDLPDVHRSLDWCDWRSGAPARYRYRVNRD